MKKLIPNLMLFILLTHLWGCAVTYVELNENYKPSSDEAIVIVGVYGIGTGWSGLKESSTSLLTGPAFQAPDYQIPERSNEVFAIPVKVGESFVIGEVSDNIVKVEFKNTKSLEITKSGIYYYGAIINKGASTIILSHKITEEIRSDIKKKYNNLLEVMESINF